MRLTNRWPDGARRGRPEESKQVGVVLPDGVTSGPDMIEVNRKHRYSLNLRLCRKHLCHAEHCSSRCIIISGVTVATEFVARRRH
jgi:hypothetical protein